MLAIFDHQEREEAELRETLGDIIIISNVGFSAAALFYLLVKIGIGIYEGCKEARKEEHGLAKTLLKILMIPF